MLTFKLKPEDREIMQIFFASQSQWMKGNTLNSVENLSNFKKSFSHFMERNHLEKNIACHLFLCTIDHQIIQCIENNLIKQYVEKKKHQISLYRDKEYIPATDNPFILEWIKESKHW